MLLDVLFGGSFDPIDILVRIFASITVIFLTMPVHEFAHAFAAYKLGDKSQKYMGRLTLNPFAHIDYIGALAILLVGFGWAKPVQVNPLYFKNPKVGMAVTSFAGPFANLITAFFGMLLFNISRFIGVFVGQVFMPYIANIFLYISIINIGLAVFNLVPVPPLDGSKILAVILPNRIYYKVMQYENYLYILLIILLATRVLTGPINFVSDFVIGIFNFVTLLPFNAILSLL